ncbi:MAG TPA: FtsX-like permease family protein [Methanomassiliicoccales archaeon]
MNSINLRSFIWKSVRRRTFRNVATILTFAVVTGSLLSVYFLVGGAENSAQAGMDRLGADMLVVPEQYQSVTDAVILAGHPTTFYFNESALSGVNDVPGVEKVAPQTYVATLNYGCCAFPTQLVAFNATQDFTIQPWLQSELGRSLAPNEIILGSQYIGGAVGFHLIFYGHDFTIAGILEPTGTGVDQSVFIQDTDAYVMAAESGKLAVKAIDLKPGEISSVLVKLAPGANANEVATEIAEKVPGVSVITSNYLARKISDQLSGTVGSLYLTAGAITLVSVPLVATVSVMVANERKREIGLLRAMGANKKTVFSVVLLEALIIAAIGALIGTAVSAAVIFVAKDLITTSLGIPFLWPSIITLGGQVALVALAAIGIGGLASLYPAIKASQLEPYEAIKSGSS